MSDNTSPLDNYVASASTDRPVDEQAIVRFLGRPENVGPTLAAVRFDTSPRKAGASSGTVLCEVDCAVDGADGVETTQLVFRYDAGSGFFMRYDLSAQYATMKTLSDAGFVCPRPLWYDSEGEIAGKPGMFMKRVQGSAPSVSPFTEGPIIDVGDSGLRHELMLNAVRTIARLNGMDASLPGFSHLVERGSGEHWLRCEIDWALSELHNTLPPSVWGDRHEFYSAAIGTVERVGSWLAANIPLSRMPEIAHGDAHLTNFMFREENVSALLDYELTHWGLGEADLAYHLAFNSSFMLFCDVPDGVPTEAELIDAYVSVRGKLDDWHYSQVMGEWRAAIFRLMGGSRLRPEFADRQRAIWQNFRQRLHALLPDTVD